MKNQTIQSWAKINICAMLLEAFGFIFAIFAIVMMQIKPDHLHTIEMLITCVILFTLGYLTGMIFSFLLYSKNKKDVQTNKILRFEMLFGFIPLINLVNFYYSTKIIKMAYSQ